jgi:hypothetical protein
MKFYTDDNKVTLVQTVASANTFVSSITGIIKNRVLQAFPKDFFNGNIYTDTMESYLEHNRRDAHNSSLHKIAYPSMTITPTLSIDDPISGMNKNILMSSPNFWLPKSTRDYMPTIISDPEDRFGIQFSSDYITLNIKFHIVVESFIQAANVGYWLKSRFMDETFKYLSNQMITVELPKTFVNIMAKILNLFGDQGELITNDEDMRTLELYLSQVGRRSGRIRKVTDMNTGKWCFMFGEKENLLTLFTDLDIPEQVIRESEANGEYEINFRVQVSAWQPNAFVMKIDKSKFQTIQTNQIIMSSVKSDMSESNGSFFSVSIAEPISLDRKDAVYYNDSKGSEQIGQNVLHETFSFSSESGISHINFGYFLKPDLLRVHAFAKDLKSTGSFDMTQLLYVVARSYSSNTPEVGTVDYDNLCVDFAEPIDTDLVLDVFVNRAVYAVLIDKMNSDSFYSNSASLATVDLTYVDDGYVDSDGNVVSKTVTAKARVYSFQSEEELSSTDINKSLRVNTPYGIGYIGLVMEGTSTASPFKICAGTDKYGNSIIRCLEIA